MAPDIFANAILTSSGTITADLRVSDFAECILLQEDGRIVVAGETYELGNDDFVVLRFNANGSLDMSFDGDGMATTALGTYSRTGDALLQPDGKILMAGAVGETRSGGDLALVRYNSNGSLDASFGSSGTVVNHIDGIFFERPVTASLQSDGKIVVLGNVSGGGDFVMARYNDNGSLDTTFGSGGYVRTDIGSENDADRIALQADGKIVVAGGSRSLYSTGVADFFVMRYNSDGSLDTSFDGDGHVATDFGGAESLSGLTLQQDGKIVVAGSSNSGSGGINVAIARYNSDGSLDATFDGDGKLVAFLGQDSEATDARVQDDGKIVVSGFFDTFGEGSGERDYVVLRYNENGSLDTSFGNSGKVVTDFGADDISKSLSLQPDGKIVVAGFSEKDSSESDIAIVRYNSNGTLDASFGGGSENDSDLIPGIAIDDFGGYDAVHTVIVQNDGRIVVVGHTDSIESGDGDFCVVRYNANGSLDTSFSGDGVVTTGFGVYDVALAAAMRADGKIVAAGFTATGSGGGDLAMARYDTNGSLDASFGIGGKVIGHIPGVNTQASGITMQSDGKIVVVSDASGGSDFSLARFNANGSLDATFGVGGFVQTSVGGEDNASEIAIRMDGKILVAGVSHAPGDSGSGDFVVVRYNADGALDSTFGAGGIARTDFGGNDEVGAMRLQSDGKIVVVGSSDAGSGGRNIAIARYNADGSPDTTFDGDGRLVTLLSGESEAVDLQAQSDGKTVVAGMVQASAGSSGSEDFVVLRYNSNGTLDTGFGDGGKVVTDLGGVEYARSLALQADGKIVLAGIADGSGSADIALVRYNSDGSLDTSFGGGSAESHPEWDFYQTPTGLTLFPGQYAVLYVQAYAADADGDPVSYYGVPGYMDGSVFTPLPGMDTFPLTEHIVNGLLSTAVLLPDTTPTGDYLFRIFADDDTGDSVPGVFFDVPVAIIDKSNFHELHFCDYGFPAWVRADWFRFDFFIAYTDFGYTVKTVLTWHDPEDGHERRESGMLSFGEVGNFNQSRFELLGTDTVALMGDADLDGKPDGFHSDDGVAVTFVWQPRNADGVVATFAVNAGSDSGSSGTLFDLDGNNAVDYARITEPDGLTIMQKFSFVDTDGNGQPDTIEIVSASVYLLTFGYDLSFTEYVYFDGHNYIEDGNFVAPLLSIDEESVSIYHYRGQGVIADADATDADGNLLVFTLVGAPDDGSGNPLFSIDAETGQISLTGAGAAWIHSASSTESFDLTIRVTDGAHDETARLSVNLRDTPEFYNGRVNVISCGSGKGVDGVSVTLTEKWATNATPATNEGYGQYGFSSLVEGDYALTVNRDVDDRDREAIDLEDVYTALTLVVDDFVDDKEQCHTSPYQYLAADIDRDGTVGFRDALGILKMALHREDAPAPEWAIVPESAGSEPMDHDNVIWPDANIMVTMDQDKEIDLVGVLTGDVDGSWGAY